MSANGVARLALRLAAAGLFVRPRRGLTATERLRSFPLRRAPGAAPVEIRWNAHLVPFIEATSDRDLVVVLGLVHAHLRLAQMELLRRLARDRLAEVLGAPALPIGRRFTRSISAINASEESTAARHGERNPLD